MDVILACHLQHDRLLLLGPVRTSQDMRSAGASFEGGRNASSRPTCLGESLPMNAGGAGAGGGYRESHRRKEGTRKKRNRRGEGESEDMFFYGSRARSVRSRQCRRCFPTASHPRLTFLCNVELIIYDTLSMSVSRSNNPALVCAVVREKQHTWASCFRARLPCPA